MSSTIFVMGADGLRERKKRETRQRIADTATRLFLLRGFDAVTVAEVAEAAAVSKMTVFNYFPRKEDMLFDRDIEAVELLTAAVGGRPAGQPVLDAVYELLRGLLADGHPLMAVGEGFGPFFAVVVESAALRARADELMRQLENALTDLLTAEAATAGDPMPRVVASLAIAGWRTAYQLGGAAMHDGRSPQQVRPELAELLERTFTGLRRAFPDYGAR